MGREESRQHVEHGDRRHVAEVAEDLFELRNDVKHDEAEDRHGDGDHHRRVDHGAGDALLEGLGFFLEVGQALQNDFERATQIARDMVMRYGMTEALGPMVYAENEGEVFLGRSVTKTTHMSEATMQMVDSEVRKIIDTQYNLARRLIEENSDKMHAMAQALMEWETIDKEQIDDIMAGKDPRPPKDWTPKAPSSGPDSGGAPPVIEPAPNAA